MPLTYLVASRYELQRYIEDRCVDPLVIIQHNVNVSWFRSMGFRSFQLEQDDKPEHVEWRSTPSLLLISVA